MLRRRQVAADISAPPRTLPATVVAGILLVVIVLEATSHATLWLAERFVGLEVRRTPEIFAEQSTKIRALLKATADVQGNHRDVYDPVLGWRYRANFHRSGEHLNSQGLRGLKEYASPAPEGVLRVAAFGDSFIYGTEVEDSSTWPAQVEQFAPHLEVLNYGVGGYGMDQALLRFQLEGQALDPSLVIIGLSPIMIGRLVNVYRRFVSDQEVAVVKPRFDLSSDGSLFLRPVPFHVPSGYRRLLEDPHAIIDLGRHDYWYEPWVYENALYDHSATVRVASALWTRVYRRYLQRDRLIRDGVFNSSASAFRLQIAILNEFVRTVERTGARPVVMLLPDQQSIRNSAAGKATLFDPVMHALTEARIDHIDLTKDFVRDATEANLGRWFMPGGHYSHSGNEVVARRLIEEIATRAALHQDPARPES